MKYLYPEPITAIRQAVKLMLMTVISNIVPLRTVENINWEYIYMDKIPNELRIIIYEYLDLDDLLSLRSTNHKDVADAEKFIFHENEDLVF